MGGPLTGIVQRDGEPAVPADPRPRQQILIHGFLQERMTEPESVTVGDDESGFDQLTHRSVNSVVLENRFQNCEIADSTRDGHGLQYIPAPLVELVDRASSRSRKSAGSTWRPAVASPLAAHSSST